jgi:Putative prokaryotic signal transducing protein
MTEEWAEVKLTDAMEAEILKAALQSIDIPVVLVGEAVGRIYGITASELGNVHVLVPPDRLDEARELIDTSQAVDFPEGD